MIVSKSVHNNSKTLGLAPLKERLRMKLQGTRLPLVGMLCLLGLYFMNVNAQQLQRSKEIASLTTNGAGIRFDVTAPHSTMTLTVSGPDGEIFKQDVAEGSFAELSLNDQKAQRLVDGQYTYELRIAPVLTSAVEEALAASRIKGNSEEVRRDLKRQGLLPGELVQSGGFAIINGAVIVAGLTEENGKPVAIAAPQTQAVPSGRVNYKMRRHHPLFVFDQVIPDDLIVQGSACIGLDCVNNESFGFDTIRLKENNTRIQFDDSSVSPGFASNNWQIRANDSPSGGRSFLGFVDKGEDSGSEAGNVVFSVAAGAPADSLTVDSLGRLGIRTAVPGKEIHMNASDTPTVRFDQSGAGGFTPQVWDIGANEANFFVRDLTAGSRLPFRIRPGAPTSSIDISATGNVGIGTDKAIHKLDVAGPMTIGTGFPSSVNVPANGLIVQGGVGIGTSAPKHKLDVAGNATIGSSYSAVTSVPANGLLVQGGVGIGTTTPDQTLTVNGNASKPGGGSWEVFSDERLKNVKGAFTSGLRAVMRLQPIRYEYKPDNALGLKMAGERIGFSAQEVKEVIPQAVSTNEQGYLTVNNDPIIWTMLNAIKEQQKEIQELKRQVRRLRTKRHSR